MESLFLNVACVPPIRCGSLQRVVLVYMSHVGPIGECCFQWLFTCGQHKTDSHGQEELDLHSREVRSQATFRVSDRSGYPAAR